MPATGRREEDERYPELSVEELLAIDQAVAACETLLVHTRDIPKFRAEYETRLRNVEAAQRALIRIGFNQDPDAEEEE
jgi:hypothetical protein